MSTTEHTRRLLLERSAKRSYFPNNRGPSKADLQRELAEAVRNTAALQPEERAE
ncbi:hypothetical protein [Bradyrhizobium cosmicum]|uniref:hypothetical protein n=1 Tax=Bradyrhizobium cosmicum TaxID=1404864 RepID=UPI00143D0CA0|nr:hypothetical protein [Bradyrhizobium cosmicum]